MPKPEKSRITFTYAISAFVTIEFPRSKYQIKNLEIGEKEGEDAEPVLTPIGAESLVDEVTELLSEEHSIMNVKLSADELSVIDEDSATISMIVKGQFSFQASDLENPKDDEPEITEAAFEEIKDDFKRLLEPNFTVSHLSIDDDGTFLGRD